MYIPEFWCGVIITILCEVVLIVAIALWASRK